LADLVRLYREDPVGADEPKISIVPYSLVKKYTKQTGSGIYEESITERAYVGDIIRDSRTLDASSQALPNVNVNNRISIVGDAYAEENLSHIRYVVWKNTAWAVKSYEISYPRIILSINGVYNG